MNKAGNDRKKWHRLRSRNQLKRINRKCKDGYISARARGVLGKRRPRDNYYTNYVRIWQGGQEETAVCTRPPRPAPANLCFRENLHETTDFFHRIRNGFAVAINRRKGGFVSRASGGAPPRISGYSDFAKIKNISMSAAVVLAADYDRLRHFLSEVPPTINLRHWDPIVVTRLYQIGFFNILGHVPDPNLLVEDGDFLLMRIIRSQTCDKLGEVDEALVKLGQFVSLTPDKLDEKITHTLSIISEVMANVTQHAYRQDVTFEYAHMGSFWVSAEADKAHRTLRIVLFDQGATIPVTYPKMRRTEKVKRFFMRALTQNRKFDYEDDGTYIRAALRYGGSRTDLDYRGKGFPQMGELLDTLGGGELRIFSRGGWCVRSRNGKVTSGSHDCSIGGTLVEWKIEL